MSIDFRPIEVGPLESNCYIIWDKESRKGAVIDPGGDYDLIISHIESLGITVEWILLTHGHFDHVFCAGAVASKYNPRIGMQALDVGTVTESMQVGGAYYDVNTFVPFSISDFLNDGDEISLGSSIISVLHTPGHSQGGLCFVTDAGVFSGDTIFRGTVGRSDFPGGSHEQLFTSIKTKILTMDDNTPLFPGHGPATTVGEERADNWYLK